MSNGSTGKEFIQGTKWEKTKIGPALVMLKEYQGQGYMRQLMEFAYEKADAYGVPCILDTDAKNKLDKYCHLGMEHVATRKLAGDCYLYDLMRDCIGS